MKPNGVVLYKGPSRIDRRSPVVCIATGLRDKSENVKTGKVIQTWILTDNGVSPIQNALEGLDGAVCGTCIHRTRNESGRMGSCYVNLIQGPVPVYNGFLRGIYPDFDVKAHLRLFKDKVLRLGSYGDPAAVPLKVWRPLIKVASHTISYTHGWRRAPAGYAAFSMASVETASQVKEAHSMGYRTFRTRLPEEPLLPNEIVCPASEEGGHRRTCAQCKACSGAGKGHSIAIIVHGLQWKLDRYRSRRLPLTILSG